MVLDKIKRWLKKSEEDRPFQIGDSVMLTCDTVPGVTAVVTKGLIVTVTEVTATPDASSQIILVEREWQWNDGTKRSNTFKFAPEHCTLFTLPSDEEIEETQKELTDLYQELVKDVYGRHKS